MSASLTRHEAILRGALALGAAGAAASVGPFVRRALAQSGRTDLDALELALSLERLEADYYRTAGRELSGLSGPVRRLVRELADSEAAHVALLSKLVGQLGGAAQRAPRFDFGDAFSSEARFLGVAQTLEETGVSAYNGAAALIEDTSILTTTGTIVQVEARHAARVRLQRGEPPAPRAFDRPLDRDQALRRAHAYLATGS
jgi:rubrerythrin